MKFSPASTLILQLHPQWCHSDPKLVLALQLNSEINNPRNFYFVSEILRSISFCSELLGILITKHECKGAICVTLCTHRGTVRPGLIERERLSHVMSPHSTPLPKISLAVVTTNFIELKYRAGEIFILHYLG